MDIHIHGYPWISTENLWVWIWIWMWNFISTATLASSDGGWSGRGLPLPYDCTGFRFRGDSFGNWNVCSRVLTYTKLDKKLASNEGKRPNDKFQVSKGTKWTKQKRLQCFVWREIHAIERRYHSSTCGPLFQCILIVESEIFRTRHMHYIVTTALVETHHSMRKL